MNNNSEREAMVSAYEDPVAYLAALGIEAELIAVDELPCAA